MLIRWKANRYSPKIERVEFARETPSFLIYAGRGRTHKATSWYSYHTTEAEAVAQSEAYQAEEAGRALRHRQQSKAPEAFELLAELLPYAEAQISADLYAGGVGMDGQLELLEKARALIAEVRG